MSERVDRDALIEAAVDAEIAARRWHPANDILAGMEYDQYWASQRRVAADRAALHIDAVLPLIADAIEAEADRRRASMAAISWGGLTHDPASAHYLRRAARLVRSLGDEQ